MTEKSRKSIVALTPAPCFLSFCSSALFRSAAFLDPINLQSQLQLPSNRPPQLLISVLPINTWQYLPQQLPLDFQCAFDRPPLPSLPTNIPWPLQHAFDCSSLPCICSSSLQCEGSSSPSAAARRSSVARCCCLARSVPCSCFLGRSQGAASCGCEVLCPTPLRARPCCNPWINFAISCRKTGLIWPIECLQPNAG